MSQCSHQTRAVYTSPTTKPNWSPWPRSPPRRRLPALSAHLIILWLSLDANITPPVALGPFAAAAIAEADPMRTGWACFPA